MLDLEGRQIEIRETDTVASALFRAGVRTFSRSFKFRRRRGLYCLTGDCPNCLLTVDGEPAVRSCRTPARDGMRVSRSAGFPSADTDLLGAAWALRRLMPVGFYYKTFVRPRPAWGLAEPVFRKAAGLGAIDRAARPEPRETLAHHPDVCVIGAGPAGQAAAIAAAGRGERVLLVDEGRPALPRGDGLELLGETRAVGIYEGPLVVLRGPERTHLAYPRRVVVATGAVERHVACPGSDLPGVWLGRGVTRLVREHGLAPGRKAVAAVADRAGLDCLHALREAGCEIVACLPRDLVDEAPPGTRVIAGGAVLAARGRRTVAGVELRNGDRTERIECDTLVLSVGWTPRDGLLRQAADREVAAVGDVVLPDGLTEAPATGLVCLCEDVRAEDLALAWEEGFRSTELLKRYTTATMGTCQGLLCGCHLSAFVRERGGSPAESAVTASRPPVGGITLEEAAAGLRAPIEQRTALHDRHAALGATFEWAGAWRRPKTYGDVEAEVRAVREAVSVMDVGTLGKFLVAGPDAARFLDQLYPCRIDDLGRGRLRYALLLNEAGFVIDDGIVCSLGEGRYYLTFTSTGADHAEEWLRDWQETWGLEVYVANLTAARGAINVAGPSARQLLARLTGDPIDSASFPYLETRELTVAGVPCLAIRLGFVGELCYELHHPSSRSVELWDALLAAGGDLGIRPHGLDALRLLRLEKGHILHGQDTDFDSTPAKLDLGWAVRLDKGPFVGRSALLRLGELPLKQKLVKIRFDGERAPAEGAVVHGAETGFAGVLTSSRMSPVLGCGVALGLVHAGDDGSFPTSVQAEGIEGRVVDQPFYDPTGERVRA